MGNKASGTAHLHGDAKHAASRFDADELTILERTWIDLAERSPDPHKGVNKETFLQYMPLNGLLGDRLFEVFDTSGDGYIDFDEFIIGLSHMGRGNMDTKVRFLFHMCDVDHTDTISKDQLTTLLNQIPTEFLHANPVSSGLSDAHSTDALHGGSTPTDTNSDSEDSKGHTSDNGERPLGMDDDDEVYEEVDNYTNHDIVEKAFNECDVMHEGRLNFEEFKMWVERTPQVIQYIEQNMTFAGVNKNPHGEKHAHKKETLPLMQRRMSLRRNQSFENGGLASNGDSPTVTASTKIGAMVRQIGRKLSMSGSSSTSISSIKASHTTPQGTPVSTPRPNDHKTVTAEHTLGRPHSTNSMISSQGGDHAGDDDSTRSRMNSNAESVEEDQAREYLLKAYESSRSQTLRASIKELLDSLDVICLAREDSNCPQEVAPHEGYLWKRGNTLHLWSKRYYVISGNCMYYYNSKEDVRVKGVVFLQGSNIQKIDYKEEMSLEIQGYYGFEITHMNLCTGEHHKHDKRVLYCRSEDDRDKWVHALQTEAHVVPILDDFVFGRELGRGRFSVVQECVNKVTNKHCAVKIIEKSTITADEKALLRTEIAVLKLVKHPNIIRMEGLYESKDHIYIVMEMLKGGELFERIVGRPRFTELEAAKLLRPLLESVAYLHDLGIVHRDLKPENILCGEELEDLKIADFGLSKMVLPTEKMEAACGTLSYVAPEVLTAQGYGKEADLWSVGVILFLLLCGKLPFDGADTNEIIRATIQGKPQVSPAVWEKLSADAKSLLNSLLNKNPKERISARVALRHTFLTTLNPHRRGSMSVSSVSQPMMSVDTSSAAASGSTFTAHSGSPPPAESSVSPSTSASGSGSR